MLTLLTLFVLIILLAVARSLRKIEEEVDRDYRKIARRGAAAGN